MLLTPYKRPGGSSVMNKIVAMCIMGFSLGCPLLAQRGSASKDTKDIDPLALQVVRAAVDPIKDAKCVSFRALVSRDELGSNGQIITTFNVGDITIQRPNKLHIRFKGRGEPVELYFDGTGKTVLYSPSAKLYTRFTTPAEIDPTLTAIAKDGVNVATRNFLESDPYRSLTDALNTAYVVGRVTLFDKEVHHLAFTEPGAEWQLWVIGGEKPVIRRMEVIDTSKPQRLRVIVEFLDWNLDASASDSMFTFAAPDEAHEIEALKLAAEK
jgi:hypothetical protein